MKKDKKCRLFNVTEEQYGNYYKIHIFEQYKLYVEMMDRVSQRRMSANTFFISINSALIMLFSLFKTILCDWGMLVSGVGIIMTLSWCFIINSYKQLNTGKFEVIHELELCLPLKLYQYEWEVLEKGKSKEKYWPLSHVELYVPASFGIIYIFIFIISLL